MIWLTWRQYRGQFLIALAILVALAIYLLYLGQATRHSYNTDILDCQPADGCDLSAATDRFLRKYETMVILVGVLLMGIPAIVGIFWGAPLVAWELETNTHRLVWNQSVTRTRWLAAKLAVVGVASTAIAGAFSLLLTWAASSYDQVTGDRFRALVFASRNIVPLGYVAFALVLGTTVGLIVRRTLPAMAATLLLLGAVQVLMPIAARPHLQTPVTERIALTAERGEITFTLSPDGPVQIHNYAIPGAWMLTSTSYLSTGSGRIVDSSIIQECVRRTAAEASECIAGHNYYVGVTYQPAQRYWTFQWLELTFLLGLSASLSAFALRWIRRIRG